jgi:hypothetical protein
MEGLMVQLRRLANNLQELASRNYAVAIDATGAPSPVEIDEAMLEVRGMVDRLRSRLT